MATVVDFVVMDILVQNLYLICDARTLVSFYPVFVLLFFLLFLVLFPFDVILVVVVVRRKKYVSARFLSVTL